MLLRQSRMAVHVVRAVHRGTALAATSSRLGLHQRAYAAQLHRLIAQSVRFAATDRSKVEYTLKMLRDDIQRQQEEESRKLKLVPAGKGVPVVKPSIYRRVVDELKHYYHGFRLLALETRLSSRYVWRVVRGSSLTRRERQQLVRTVADIFRLVPFSVFVIVPFMEFTLPIFLKLFPGMLPSTFQEASKEQEKIRTQLKAKMEMAKFLQDTIEEIALEKKDAKKDGEKGGQALEFAHFIKKVRTEGGYVSNADLLRFSKLFEDELTLDSLSMSQLRALCRLVNVQPLGTPEILRFQLNLKLRELKADDKQIALEGGVDVLSTSDLQAACRARGMRSLGLSEDRLQEQLRQWLELSLRDDVPPSFLLLSRTLYLPEDVTFTDRLKALVSSMPESIAEQTRQKLTEIEGGKVNYKERLELIKNIEAAIKDERTKAADVEKREVEAKKLKEEKEAAAKEGAVLSSTMEKKATTAEKLIDKVHEVVDKAHARVEELKTETVALATDKTLKKDLAKKDVKTEPKLDPKDLKQIEDILHGSTAAEAKHDILGLKEKVIEHTEDLIEVGALDGAFAETKIAKRLRTKLNSMIENVDQLVNKLEVTKRSVDESIADPAIPDAAKIKKAQQVRIADLINTLHGIKAATDDEGRTKRIEELLNALDQDHDGVIDKQLGIEVIDLLTKHADVPLGASQLANIVETLKKEDDAEAMSRAFDENPLVNPIQPQGPQLSPKAAEKAAEAAAQKSLPEPPLDVPEVSTPTAPLQQKSPQKPPEHPKL